MVSSASTHHLLAVRSLGKRYRGVTALDGVSFDVMSGEVLGLVGPNGAGKTTLFECLAGVQHTDAGSVDGPDAGGMFYMPDGIAPWDAQPVRWVTSFFAGLHGCDPAVRDRIIGDVGLRELADQAVGVLSRGQRKRLLVALALMTPHALLLLDEPFEGLDLRQTRQIAAVLRAAADGGRTLFLSIHQLTDAQRVCDRMILLSAGRVVAHGSIETLRAQADMPDATLEEVFLALT